MFFFFLLQYRQILFELFKKNYRVRRTLVHSRLTQELGDNVTKADVDRLLKVTPPECTQPSMSLENGRHFSLPLKFCECLDALCIC